MRDLWANTQGTPGVKRGTFLFKDSECKSYLLWLAVETEASETLGKNDRTIPYQSFLESLQGLCPPKMVDENVRESLTQRLHDRILLTFEPGDGGTPQLIHKKNHEQQLKSRLRGQAKFLQFLNLLIRLGNAQEVWQWCPPTVPMLLDREPTPFTPEGIEGYLFVQHVRKLLWKDLQSGRTPEGLAAEGRILISALLYGGLGEVAALRELHKALRVGAPLNYFPRLGWSFLDLEIPMGRGGMRLRRWLPDPLSEILILRYVPIRQPIDQYTTTDLLKAMNAYLRLLPKDQRKFLRARQLIRSVPQTLRIEQPQFLGAYASGDLTAHAVRSDRWWRLHGYEYPGIVASAISTGSPNGRGEDAPSKAQETRQDMPLEVAADVSEAIHTVPWLQSLRTILRGNNRAFALQRLDAKSREELPDLLSRLFYGWAERMLKHGSAYRHRLAMRTIRRYVSRLAALMLQLLEDSAAIETFRDSSWRQLYEDLLDHVETEHQRALLARAIREWHQYLVEENRAIPLPDQDLGGLAIDVVPDARIISLKEFIALKEVIARGRHVERHVHLPIVLTLIAILGFRCGLRRMEVLRLRIMDCHLTGRATLLIRPFAERSLKSRNATRAIPIYALLEEEELNLLREWVLTREESGGQPQDYLFVLSEIGHNPISQETAMSRIHEALRLV
ncbi:MAG: hypothetical protein JJ714_09170, partial [Acidithiobacillus sp.]|nr:hypothetical protein [Acidithiobacillus sp.]